MTEKLKVVFAPGCFDGFDGSEEELAELLAEIHKMAEDGTLFENSKQLSEEEVEELKEQMEKKETRQ